jgi:hypothetical protein
MRIKMAQRKNTTAKAKSARTKERLKKKLEDGSLRFDPLSIALGLAPTVLGMLNRGPTSSERRVQLVDAASPGVGKRHGIARASFAARS